MAPCWTRRCRHERRARSSAAMRRTRSSAIRAGFTPSRASGRSRWPPSASAMRRAVPAVRSSRPPSWPRRRSPPSSAPAPPSALRLGRAGVLAMVTWAALGGRSLADEARRLALRVEAGDLDGAREVLPSLCGRDPAGLDAQGLSRAAVESVAENTADAVVGALLWGAVAGPAGIAALPRRQHARRHGRPSQRALRVLRLGRGAPRRRPELARRAAGRRCWRRCSPRSSVDLPRRRCASRGVTAARIPAPTRG